MYKEVGNKLTHTKELAKKQYYNGIIDKAKHNTALIWKVINDILKYKVKSSHCIVDKLMDENGQTIQDPQAIADKFNLHFSQIGSKTADKTSSPSTNCNFSVLTFIKSNPSSLYLSPITEQEIRLYLHDLNSSKSSGIFGIPIKFVKMSSEIIAPLLTKLFNQCFSKGIFPESLKLAEIKPIHKKGPKECLSNYRSSLLLSPFSKILEKCIYTRLYHFLQKHNLFNKNQFGFRQNCSTSHAVSEICNDFLQNRDAGEIFCGIFLDLEKAFDTINHEVLLLKLQKYGVRGLAFDLFQNYLNHRKHYTVINGRKSIYNYSNCGIPQGSILGPLLFIIYMNDLPAVSNFRTRLFADDTSLTISNKSSKTLQQVVNH